MAQIPNLQSTNTLGEDDQAILRQGTIDKRISLYLAGVLSWARRNGYVYLGEHATGVQFSDSNSFTLFQGKPYFVKPEVTLPYSATGNDPSTDTNLEVRDHKPFVATGTDVSRGIEDRAADTVNLKDFVEDNTVDASVEIQKALDFITSEKKVLIVEQPYLYSQTLTAISSEVVDIRFVGDGELICTSDLPHGLWISSLPYLTDTSPYWDVTQRADAISVTADITAYDREIALGVGHGLVKGDWIRIASTEAHTTIRSQYRKGELHEVLEVDGTTVSLDSGTFDSYTAADTSVFKLTPPNVNLQNLKMSSTVEANSTRGVTLWECVNVTITSPTIEGFNDNNLDLSFCADAVVNKPSINYATKPYTAGSRTSYGLVVNSSQYVLVSGGTLKGGRHSFSSGGYDPNRYITVHGTTIMSNDVDDLDVAAMDSHENMEGLSVTSCTIYGGANLAGQDVNFSNNKVVISGEVLRAVEFRPAKTCDYIIANGNSINTTQESAGGIVIRHYADNTVVRKVSTNNNAVVLNTQYARLGIGFEPVQPNGQKVELWECRGNQVTVNATTLGATCLGNWDSADLTDRVDFSVVNIEGNYLFNALGNCLNLRQKTESRIGTLNIGNNTMISRGAATFTLLYFKYVNFHNNEALGDDSTKYNQVRYTDNFNWSNSRITYSDYFGCRLIDVDNVQESNITRENCADTSVEYSNTFSPSVHCWGTYSSSSDSAEGAYRCTIAQNGATGRYLVTWGAENRHPQEFFTMIATPHFDGRAYCIPNNYTSCFVFLKDAAGSPVAGDFSFQSC